MRAHVLDEELLAAPQRRARLELRERDPRYGRNQLEAIRGHPPAVTGTRSRRPIRRSLSVWLAHRIRLRNTALWKP